LNLVYIYGPPGVGKFTVGTELARLTGYRLFHNHLSIAAIEPVFDFGTDTFWRLVHSIREEVISSAAQQGIDVIFTNVYEHPSDLPRALRRFELTEAAGGHVCPVKLTCELAVLESRLQTPDRGAMRKLTDVEVFRANAQAKDVFSAIPGRPSLEVDTTHLSPEEAAMGIIKHYGLAKGSA
jgi:hypothetical protein